MCQILLSASRHGSVIQSAQICFSEFIGADSSRPIGVAGDEHGVKGKISPYPEMTSSHLLTVLDTDQTSWPVCSSKVRNGLLIHSQPLCSV